MLHSVAVGASDTSIVVSHELTGKAKLFLYLVCHAILL